MLAAVAAVQMLVVLELEVQGVAEMVERLL
jgi:hypothetical protein